MNNINRIEFIKMILNDEYILWLSNFAIKNNEFNDVYFTHNNKLSPTDLYMINNLKYLFLELNAYNIKNNINYDIEYRFRLKHENLLYIIEYDSECYSCKSCNMSLNQNNCIEYIDLKLYEAQMCKLLKHNNQKILKK